MSNICPGCGGEGAFHNHPCPILANAIRHQCAQAIEAQRAATVKQGAVADESAVAESDAPKGEPS